jgi:hypothetical protein
VSLLAHISGRAEVDDSSDKIFFDANRFFFKMPETIGSA